MRISFRQVNHLLLAAIIIINLYIIVAPFAPAALFWWQESHTDRKEVLTSKIHQQAQQVVKTAPINQPNHLTVPAMLLDTPILEGPVSQQYKTLDKGIWRLPFTSTPDKGGNTVIVGHRFTYTNPRGIFYYLNKVQIGNELGVVWNNKSYLYRVSSINEVPPTQIGVQDNTPDSRLTLYTCTPLWNPKDRLVVVAELEK